ncbi:MAG: hypothetical protein U5L45_10355 [Saprospiraceae bacterium]|nr:hypothetical protein [Saprospiraceae bacterium]
MQKTLLDYAHPSGITTIETRLTRLLILSLLHLFCERSERD